MEETEVSELNQTSEIRHLVTTALQKTWPESGEILVLGTWCLRYSQSELWRDKPYSILAHPWDDRSRIPEDLKHIDAVYEELLEVLTLKMNELHDVSKTKKYWRIVLGPWLYLFTQVIFERWMMIERVGSWYPGIVLNRLKPDRVSSPPRDMSHFYKMMVTDEWNEALYADIAELQGSIEVRYLPFLQKEFIFEYIKTSHRILRGLSRFLTKTERISRKIFRLERQSIFMHADYLQRFPKIKFSLLTGTSPFPSSTDSTWGASESNSNERDWSLEFDGDDDFAKILSVLIPVHMPSAYVEYYADIAHTANDGTWLPARADVLVTANSFDGDEKWKIWAAGQVDQGAKLVIAQHGGHYGTGAWSAPQNHEIAIADRYLTWGWKDNRYHNVMPAPATKLIGLRRNRVRRSDLCLTALGVLPRYSYWIYSVPIAHQYERYLEDQIHFISCLSPDVRKSLEVRITKNDFGWDLEQRLKQFHSELIVDPGNSHFLHRLKKSRLFVATYNATTYLESFRLGVPTVMHWDPNYWEISSQAKPYFDLLSEAGVFFSDAEQCAEHVNEIWANVSQWWKAEKVQNAVEVFANEFAYVGERPLRELKRKISRFEKGSQSVVIDRHR